MAENSNASTAWPGTSLDDTQAWPGQEEFEDIPLSESDPAPPPEMNPDLATGYAAAQLGVQMVQQPGLANRLAAYDPDLVEQQIADQKFKSAASEVAYRQADELPPTERPHPIDIQNMRAQAAADVETLRAMQSEASRTVPYSPAGQAGFEAAYGVPRAQALLEEQAAVENREARQEINESGLAPGLIRTGLLRWGGNILDQASGVLPRSPVGQFLSQRAGEALETSGIREGIGADIARGAGNVGSLIVGNPSGLPGLMTAVGRGAAQTQSQVLRDTGETEAAAEATLRTYPTLGAYMLAGYGTGRIIGGMLGSNATAIQRGLAEFGGATAANVATSKAIHAIEGQPYTMENLATDVLFGFVHGKAAYGNQRASERTRQQAQAELMSRGFAEGDIATPQAFESRMAELGMLAPKEEAAPAGKPAQAWPGVPAEPAQPSPRAGRAIKVESPEYRAPKLSVDAEAPEAGGLRPLPTGQETGGIFAPRRPKIVAPGLPPSGNRTWLKIPSSYVRGLGRGLFTEGAQDVLLKRQDNPIGKQLAHAATKQYDVEASLAGSMGRHAEKALEGMSSRQQARAFDEVEFFLREKENGRVPPPLGRDATKLYEAWQDIAEDSGLLAQANNIQVMDKGHYRPMRLLGREYTPRMFDTQFERVIRDPESNPTLFANYAQELATQRGISLQEATLELNALAGGKGRYGNNDFLGNLELARQERYPESFYEYDLRNLMARYIPGYARRMGQIIAYGQRLGEGGMVQKNLWDLARDEVRGGDKTTAEWLNEAEAQSTNERIKSSEGQGIRRLQSIATGTLLASGIPTLRNLISGIVTSAEVVGARRTLMGLMQAFSSAKRADMRELGVVREDMATMLHADQLSESPTDRAIRGTVNTMLNVSGYNAAETAVRTANGLAAASFIRDYVTAATKNPNSRRARQMAGHLQRLNIDPQRVLDEGGDWKTSTEAAKGVRAFVNAAQGGYKFNQVPLWAGTPMGRFLVQFIRYATQRSANLRDNIIKPAVVGTETTINGTKQRVRSFMPLIKMGAGLIGAGEAYALIAQGIFGRDRKDHSLDEIANAPTDEKMMNMIGGRLINDIIMSGGLGVWGQPLDAAVAAKDGSRLKNPAEPPSGAGVRALIQLTSDFFQQGGDLSRQDIKRFLSSTVPLVQNTRNAIDNFVDAPLYEAENDVRTLRQAAQRFADAKGLDVNRKAKGGESTKGENTPFYSELADKLLIGDSPGARKMIRDYLNKIPPGEKRDSAERAIASSMRGRQPFQLGTLNAAEWRDDFDRWAKKNLGKDDAEQIRRVQARYDLTGRKLGLWSE